MTARIITGGLLILAGSFGVGVALGLVAVGVHRAIGGRR